MLNDMTTATEELQRNGKSVLKNELSLRASLTTVLAESLRTIPGSRHTYFQ